MNNHSKIDLRYGFVIAFSTILILFGLSQNHPIDILTGLWQIMTQPAGLVTDYMGISNMGAAFANAGLVTLLFTFLLYRLKQPLNGPFIAALLTIAGFSFFGKNLFNVWFIIIGVKCYSKFIKEPFTKFLIPALFGTAMAPAVSEIAFGSGFTPFISIPLGIFAGVALGFVIPPLGASLINVHHGFNLYNIGFTAGMVGMAFVSIIGSFSYVPVSQFIWTTGHNQLLGIFMIGLFVAITLFGFFLNGNSFKNYTRLFKHSGQLVTDFVQLEGFAVSLINIGVMGILSTLFVLATSGDLNGPTLGGILTVAGFSAFGKHPKNCLPIFGGVFIASLMKSFAINDPSVQLAALFGTALAPIAGEFGWKWGLVAGFLHSSLVMNVGFLHGGLNLYNNGFAAGLGGAILVPIINTFKKRGQ